jgi:hypothetical protein
MKAARCLISREGDLEKGWKRLFGRRSGRSDPSAAGVGVNSPDAGTEGVLCSWCAFEKTVLTPVLFEGP